MITLPTALMLISIHLIYYFILQVVADLMRIGSVTNTSNKIITKLRSQYKVNLLTFQKNTAHYGFAWFKSIYLNESLFRNERALMFTFFHELYHVQKKHKQNTLLLRLVFSHLPILLIFHWMIFLPAYIFGAWYLFKVNEHYETNANDYANQMIKNEPTNNAKKGRKSN